jgi:hypothetical protein
MNLSSEYLDPPLKKEREHHRNHCTITYLNEFEEQTWKNSLVFHIHAPVQSTAAAVR